MGMVVRTNVPAMNANRQLGVNSNQVSKSLEKLSSGFKINRASDDASGLAISEKMKAQIKGLETASANSQDGISLIQTAEGGAQEIHDMLNRMVELATKSANGTIQDDVDREAIQREVDDLNSEITRIAQSTNFNGINLLDGNLAAKGVDATLSSDIAGNSIMTYKPLTTELKGAGSLNIKTTDLSGVDWSKADVLTIDGQDVTIDWSKMNTSDKALITTKFTATGSGAGEVAPTKETVDKAMQAITDTINLAIDAKNAENKLNGVDAIDIGHVNVTADFATGKLNITGTSTNKDSELTVKTVETDGLLNKIGVTAAGTSAVKAGDQVAGPSVTLAQNAEYNMYIGGEKILMKNATALDGTKKMSEIATAVQADIRTAVTNYNATKSAAEQLTATDFTVEIGDEGNLVVKYGGPKDINKLGITFEGENAAILGLDGAKSQASAEAGKSGLTLQIGDTGADYNKVTVSVEDLSAKGIGTEGLDVSNQEVSNKAIDTIKAAINKVSTNRANLGSLQNRLEHTINNLDTTAENMTAANSRIRDTDMAKEMMNYTKMNVLVQSAQAMLAQANQSPQSILQLLQ